MIIDTINLNHLRIFECVYKLKSMTDAARELHLTQSGVSQHMKALEEMLGVKLFDRIRQRVVATQEATILYKRCQEGLYGIEEALSQIKGAETTLSGTVSIGLPPEFGNNVVLPLLVELGKKHERIHFNVVYGFASEVMPRVLNGDIDFAFVDSIGTERRLALENVYHEVLSLCASESLLAAHSPVQETLAYLEKLPYIEYVKGEEILQSWFRHHFKRRMPNLEVRATVMAAQGVARCVQDGLGAGILPGHRVTRLKNQGHRIHIFEGCGKPFRNAIGLASLKERTYTRATLEVMGSLKSSLRALKQKNEVPENGK